MNAFLGWIAGSQAQLSHCTTCGRLAIDGVRTRVAYDLCRFGWVHGFPNVRLPPEAVIGPGCCHETRRYIVDGQANNAAKHLSCAPPRKVMVGRFELPIDRATLSRCHHLADDAVSGQPRSTLRGVCDGLGAFNYAEEIDGRSHGAIPSDA